MIDNQIIKSICLLLFLFIGCKEPQPKEGMSQADLSAIICNCASPLVQFNTALQALAKGKDMGALAQRMSAGDQLMKSAVDCVIDKIDEKAKSLLDDELTTLITDLCQLDQRMQADFFEKIDNYNFPSF